MEKKKLEPPIPPPDRHLRLGGEPTLIERWVWGLFTWLFHIFCNTHSYFTNNAMNKFRLKIKTSAKFRLQLRVSSTLEYIVQKRFLFFFWRDTPQIFSREEKEFADKMVNELNQHG